MICPEICPTMGVFLLPYVHAGLSLLLIAALSLRTFGSLNNPNGRVQTNEVCFETLFKFGEST